MRDPIARMAGLGALGAACIICASGNALAQSSANGLASATLTWTDNATNAPDDITPGETGRLEAWMLALVPGIAFHHNTPRNAYSATYTHAVQLYLNHDEPTQESDVLTLNGVFSLSERDQLTLTLLGSHSRTSDFLSIPSQRSSVAPTPVGTTRIVSIAAEEQYSRSLTESWVFGQSAGYDQAVPVFEPVDAPAFYTLRGGLSLSHTRPRDSYRISSDVSYLGTARSLPPEVDEPLHWSGSTSATWTHQWLLRVSSELGAGAAYTLRDSNEVVLTPTLFGSLTHTGERVSESITGSRTMAPDTLTGTILISDTVEFAAIADLAQQGRLSARTSHGYSSNRIVGADTVSPRFRIWTSEVGLDWAIIPGGLRASAIYQYTRQTGLDEGEEVLGLADFHRNQAMLVLAGQFPQGGISLSRSEAPPIRERARERPLGGGPGSVGSRLPQGTSDGDGATESPSQEGSSSSGAAGDR